MFMQTNGMGLALFSLLLKNKHTATMTEIETVTVTMTVTVTVTVTIDSFYIHSKKETLFRHESYSAGTCFQKESQEHQLDVNAHQLGWRGVHEQTRRIMSRTPRG
jgi:hypothetical protein